MNCRLSNHFSTRLPSKPVQLLELQESLYQLRAYKDTAYACCILRLPVSSCISLQSTDSLDCLQYYLAGHSSNNNQEFSWWKERPKASSLPAFHLFHQARELHSRLQQVTLITFATKETEWYLNIYGFMNTFCFWSILMNQINGLMMTLIYAMCFYHESFTDPAKRV